MMLKTVALLLISFLTAAASTARYDGKDRANDLIVKAREAMGGTAKLSAIQSLEVSAKLRRIIQEQDVSGELVLEFLLPDRFKRTETMEFAGGAARVTRISALNGEEQWDDASATGHGQVRIARPGGDSPTARAAQLNETRAEMSRYLFGLILASTAAVPLELTYSGEAEAPDGKAYVIAAKGPNNFSATLFLDKNNLQPLMLSYKAPAPQFAMIRRDASSGSHEDVDKAVKEATERPATEPRQVEIQLSLSDYRTVDGIRLPHRITRSTDGKVNEEIEVEKYKINPPLKVERFKK